MLRCRRISDQFCLAVLSDKVKDVKATAIFLNGVDILAALPWCLRETAWQPFSVEQEKSQTEWEGLN